MGEEPGIFVKIFLDISGFPGGSQMVKKESACNEGDLGLIPGSERSPREGYWGTATETTIMLSPKT